MNFSLSSLAASFVFGVFGIYVFRFGKKHSHAASIILGLALMIYPYFIENVYLMWGLGAILTIFAYKMIAKK